jgi:hypothetical protein
MHIIHGLGINQAAKKAHAACKRASRTRTQLKLHRDMHQCCSR